MNYNPTTLLLLFHFFALVLKTETFNKTNSRSLFVSLDCYLFHSLNFSVPLQFKTHFVFLSFYLIVDSLSLSLSLFLLGPI